MYIYTFIYIGLTRGYAYGVAFNPPCIPFELTRGVDLFVGRQYKTRGGGGLGVDLFRVDPFTILCPAQGLTSSPEGHRPVLDALLKRSMSFPRTGG